MDCSVLIRVNEYSLLFPDNSAKPTLINGLAISNLPNDRTIPVQNLRNFGLPHFTESIFVHKEPHFVAICSAEQIDRRPFYIPRQKAIESLRDKAELLVAKWIADRNRKLVNGLFGKSESLEECVATIADYTLSDGYSLWFYNPISKVFTCPVSSAVYKKRFITESDNSSLYRFLSSKVESESRQPIADACLAPELREMQTLNRLLINYQESDVKGVLNLYSRNTNFKIEPEIIPIIQNALAAKHTESRIESQRALDAIELFCIKEYKSGALVRFLHGLVCRICTEFSFEGCSIFLKDQETGQLALVATCDNDHQGEPSERIIYDLSKQSLTADVFKNGQIRFSYDLQNDPYNSKTYNEKTSLVGTNWIGVPLQTQLEGVCGVLRVKNRYQRIDANQRVIKNIRSIDFGNIMSVGTLLSGYLELETKFIDLLVERQSLEKELEALNNFNQMFLHEIRTPLSTFGLAPLLISRLLTKTPLVDSDLAKVKMKLEDIKVMGERLKFITDTYFIEDLISKNDVVPLSLLRDVVFPVLNITREYYRRKYGLEVRLDPYALEGQVVFGDKTLLNIVFNAMVDNACKYSYPQKRPVVVAGKLSDLNENVCLLISNYGMHIEPDETDKIFQKGVRGRLALEKKYPGTGIGLYLAKEIMKRQRGELTLVNLKDPVTFAISLPRMKE